MFREREKKMGLKKEDSPQTLANRSQSLLTFSKKEAISNWMANHGY